MSFLSRLILSGISVFWLSGLLLPALYVLFLKNIKKPIVQLSRMDIYIWAMFIFLILQIISVSLSFYYDFFTWDRLAAIGHNLMAYSFLILGYSFGSNEDSRLLFIKNLKKIFLFLSIGSVGVFAFSILTSKYVEYPGILQIVFGGKSEFTSVIFNQVGWVAGHEFPRSRMMGIFPNNSAILILIVYVLFFYYNDFKGRKKIFYGMLFVLATMTTGSRNGTIIALFIFVFQFVYNKQLLFVCVFFLPLFLILGLFVIAFLSQLREDSNDTRYELYWSSIKYSFEYNPLFGIGIKPKVDQIAGGELPIGSHSTLLGYFVKNGIIGGLFALFAYLFFIYTAFGRLLIVFLTKKVFSTKHFILNIGIVFVLLSLLLDDLDAYEIVPFFLGFMIFAFKTCESNSSVQTAKK